MICGKKIPTWINRLAYVSTCIPFLERCIPKELLIPIALENSIHENDEVTEEEESQSTNFNEDDEVILKESSSTTSSSSTSASSSSFTCFSPSTRRRGSASYPCKNNASTKLINWPRSERPNRPFSNLKR